MGRRERKQTQFFRSPTTTPLYHNIEPSTSYTLITADNISSSSPSTSVTTAILIDSGHRRVQLLHHYSFH